MGGGGTPGVSEREMDCESNGAMGALDGTLGVLSAALGARREQWRHDVELRGHTGAVGTAPVWNSSG